MSGPDTFVLYAALALFALACVLGLFLWSFTAFVFWFVLGIAVMAALAVSTQQWFVLSGLAALLVVCLHEMARDENAALRTSRLKEHADAKDSPPGGRRDKPDLQHPQGLATMLIPVTIALAVLTAIVEFQVLALGWRMPTQALGGVSFMPTAQIGALLAFNFIIGSSLMRARRRALNWKVDTVDYLTTLGPAAVFAISAFTLLNHAATVTPAGVTVNVSELQALTLVGFFLFHFDDVLKLFRGRDIDEKIGETVGRSAAPADTAKSPASAPSATAAPRVLRIVSTPPGEHIRLEPGGSFIYPVRVNHDVRVTRRSDTGFTFEAVPKERAADTVEVATA